MPRKTSSHPPLPILPGTLWILIFMLLPLIFILTISLLTRDPYGDYSLPLTSENYTRLFGFGTFGFDPIYLTILLRTITLAITSTALTILLGVPVAFCIASLPKSLRAAGLLLIAIPFWTNLLIRTYAWQILLGPDGWVTTTSTFLFHTNPQGLYPSYFAIMLGLLSDYLPYLILPVYASVEKINYSLIEAAQDLGASRFQTFRHATLPQILPGILAGGTLVLIPALGQFVIPDLLGGSKAILLGNITAQQFGASRDWPFGAATAALQLLVAFIFIRFIRNESSQRAFA